MKKKMIALLLAGTICLSLTACGQGSVSTAQDSNFEKKALNIIEEPGAGADTGSEQEEYDQIEVPDSITNISPEDDQALTGTLTEDAYTNDYFGIKINKIDGGTIESLMDSGKDLTPLSETYVRGVGGIYINSTGPAGEGSISAIVSALLSDQEGKTEEDLARDRYDLEQSLNGATGYDAECAVEKITVAGEEHTAYIEVSNDEDSRTKSAAIYMVKGDFQCSITVYAPEDQFEDRLKLIEKY